MDSTARVVSIAGRSSHRCRAQTRKGNPCRNRAIEGTEFCHAHAPAAGLKPAGRLSESLAPLGISLDMLRDFLGRRFRGDYEVDEFGFDRELTELMLPTIEPILDRYWRVDVVGTENVPTDGAALLVANHAGTLPLDGFVLRGVVWQNPPHRHARMVVADFGFSMPFFSHFVRKTGNTMACPEDTHRLLSRGELVAVFPEGVKGVGKGWRQRYRLQRFGRGGFVEVAIQAGVPIIPVAIVGSEEIYPMIGDVKPLARLLGLPYFPVTMFFPWLGPLGMIPLPSKWIIEYCEPVRTDHVDRDAARDPMTVLEITDEVRASIQRTILANLRKRRTIFG